jgi:putative ABC transport system substrate-binding protein
MAADTGRLSFSRRRFVQGAGVAGLGLVAGCGRLLGQAQQPTRAARVGVLFAAVSPSSPEAAAFREGLLERGWREGQNIAIEYRSAEGREETLSELIAELLRLPVDVLVVVSEPAIRVARQATKTVPIVMSGSSDPISNGFIETLARPGGNVTGLSLLGARLHSKRLELLTEAVPGLAHVAAVGTPEGEPELRDAARLLGVRLQLLVVHSPGELDAALETATSENAGAIMTLGGPTVVAHLPRIARLARENHMPAISPFPRFAHEGGLMAYGPNNRDQWLRSATYVDRILKGAKPADLPVEQPREFDFVINLRTAQALGLTIPPHVLLQATEVIQ